MRFRLPLHRLAAPLLAAAVLAGAAQAQERGAARAVAGPAPGGFDGTWLVILTCTGARDGTAGYTRRFLAAVQNGMLHGEIGVRGQASYLALDGPIQPDGNALLSGRGMTGSAEYAVGRPSPGTPYQFTMQAWFDGTHGTGRRIEVRPCEAVFTRQ